LSRKGVVVVATMLVRSSRGPRRGRARVVCVLLSVGGLVAGWRRRPRRVAVTGSSMAPGLLPGDRLLVVPARRLRPGDVVLVRDPRVPARRMVKRVAAVLPEGVDVRGDDPDASTDSRLFGPVPRGLVEGRAAYRYAPPGRVGRIG
jgi:nickel-type superoxide dismutase maturation protease